MAGPAGPAGASAPVFNAAGAIASPKFWTGDVTTTTGGAWSAAIGSAGCTSLPRVHVSTVSAGSTLAQSATAIVTARTTTSASGFVNVLSATGTGTRAGASLTVSVLAICS